MQDDKEELLKVLYDLEVALKSKKDVLGDRVYDDIQIRDILRKFEESFDQGKYKLVKKKHE